MLGVSANFVSARSAATLVGVFSHLPRTRRQNLISFFENQKNAYRHSGCAVLRFGKSLGGDQNENLTEKFVSGAASRLPSCFVAANRNFSSVAILEQQEEQEQSDNWPIQCKLTESSLMKSRATTKDRETDEEKIIVCRNMFSRLAQGQELLRRNHGVPILHQQDLLDQFTRYLITQYRYPAEVIEMLEHMRCGSLMNNAGGTSGGRLRVSKACTSREPAFVESVCRSFFGRSGPSVHFELFPSTTKSIEALVSLLAHEAEIRERPIKLLVPSDAHYCWTNVAGKHGSHPYL